MVVDPLDWECAVQSLSFPTELYSRLHCDDHVTAPGEFCSIAARSRANVEHSDRLHWKQVNQVPVDLSKGNALVLRS